MTEHATTHLTRIADGVHVWAPDGAGTWGLANCVLVSSGTRAALVDTPYTTALAEQLLTAARRVLPTGATFDTVINTHANGDHCYSNAFFTGAEIIATESCREHACFEPAPDLLHQLVHGSDPGQPLGRYLRRHFGRYDYRGIQLAPPTRTFTAELTVHPGDEDELHLIEVGPAHTAGDLIVHLPRQRVVCTGDVFFAGDHPVHWAGPLERVMDACRRILDLRPQTVVPGHGPVVGPAALREHLDYLADLRGRIHTLHARGLDERKATSELLRENRHPHLGLPERLAILTAVEYRHLGGVTEPPDLLAFMAEAARHAQEAEQAR
ncbi:MBL fold metallo-hydrolase [Streptomyces sp. RB6PN25]|uniref:MBL fold metallo-hydrolase n=1 Tax=Streptomyces humicola TaxID=2953240 RepID=A0ABT1PPM1_9ACTN|nr:MBL fold metallo-hydrolase [Streptomyces humicola]MCQ4079619.1 MBL fold metallo-hydrolase [Streptomyces humicola]